MSNRYVLRDLNHDEKAFFTSVFQDLGKNAMDILETSILVKEGHKKIISLIKTEEANRLKLVEIKGGNMQRNFLKKCLKELKNLKKKMCQERKSFKHYKSRRGELSKGFC
ncbi:hypothetical protein COLO4_16360 [Corchorus olitorius]|uniref:Uncharacterized protein n=1 Tax=Corchorus olitorius TaxID=93759 RepID=A0A1R3JHY0_9ROSI|nr:hypothetical protein COLO4_16360 [Corchorus olitorius]